MSNARSEAAKKRREQQKKAKVTSSSTSSARSKASKAKVSGANSSSRRNRQKASTAKVTNAATRGNNTGRGSSKITTGKGATGGRGVSPGLMGTTKLPKLPPRAPKPQFKTREVGPNTKLAPSGPPVEDRRQGTRSCHAQERRFAGPEGCSPWCPEGCCPGCCPSGPRCSRPERREGR